MVSRYSLLRFKAILTKEFVQIKRDYLIYLSIVLVPMLQAIFFGYVINTDPKHLPTVVVSSDQSQFTQQFITGLQNTNYFDIKPGIVTEATADRLLQLGRVEFVINLPVNFSRALIRSERPTILLEADATDPVAVVGAYDAAKEILPKVLASDFQGTLHYLSNQKPSLQINLHSKYNPEMSSHYHSLPGVIVVVLASVLVMLTAVSMSSEYEQGTFEILLSTPAQPTDIILAKLLSHFLVGYTIFFLLLLVTRFIFNVPFEGNAFTLSILAIPYMLSTLCIGLIVSVLSKTQMEAATFSNFYILPAMLLCGFVFPYYGMPKLAQYIGNLFPTTHFLRIIYGIMLKGSSFLDVWEDTWPILVFLAIALFLCIAFYKRTLD